jgi:hypothetical protein
MHIRPATYSEIGKLMAIFGNAKSIMRSSGIRHQWDGNYPTEDIIRRDIDNGNCYVLCRKGDIIGTMALIPGPDSTYAEIDGEWPDDESYYVIHRIAAASTGGNIARTMLDCAQNVTIFALKSRVDITLPPDAQFAGRNSASVTTLW